jgi:hypothetical protein
MLCQKPLNANATNAIINSSQTYFFNTTLVGVVTYHLSVAVWREVGATKGVGKNLNPRTVMLNLVQHPTRQAQRCAC